MRAASGWATVAAGFVDESAEAVSVSVVVAVLGVALVVPALKGLDDGVVLVGVEPEGVLAVLEVGVLHAADGMLDLVSILTHLVEGVRGLEALGHLIVLSAVEVLDDLQRARELSGIGDRHIDASVSGHLRFCITSCC